MTNTKRGGRTLKINGSVLNRTRTSRGITLTQLGQAIGIHNAESARKAIQRAEADSKISPQHLVSVCRVLGVEQEVLLSVQPAVHVVSNVHPSENALLERIASEPDNLKWRNQLAIVVLSRTDGEPTAHVNRAIGILGETIVRARGVDFDWAVAHRYLGEAIFRQIDQPAGFRIATATAVVFRALEYFERTKGLNEENLIEWSHCQSNLGVLLAQYPDSSKWTAAIEHMEAAREIKRLRDPARHYKTVRNLGNTYMQLFKARGEGWETQLGKALQCYLEAEEFLADKKNLIEYIRLQYTMSDAFLLASLEVGSEHERERHREAALKHAKNAYYASNDSKHGVDWANATFNLAMCYLKRPDATKADLVTARDYFVDCLRVFTPKTSMEEYAGTLLPLAETKWRVAEIGRANAGELYREAIAHMKKVCEVFPTDAAHQAKLGELRSKYEKHSLARRVPFSQIEPGLGA
jgi:tetratricopeptide (TPR) repeat protein/transcriptional regulator with XRE-family HTH domain